MDVGQSLLNYNAGEKNPGFVPFVGWDMGTVGLSGDGQTTRAYTFNQPGLARITATLAWNRLVNLGDIAQTGFTNGHWDTEDRNFNGVLNPGEDVDGDGNLDVETLTAMTLNDLDLEIWNTTLGQRVFFSSSDIDSIEHFDWTVPLGMRDNQFELRVTRFRQFGPTDDRFGVAWIAAVPEPSSIALASLGGLVLAAAVLGKRRRSKRS
jgi:hypothetical protein